MALDLTPHTVGEPITDGLHTVNFFNGRLLSAGDLRREQETERALRERAGRAIGEGVIEGLEVSVSLAANTASDPVVVVKEGTALARSGVALRLSRDVLVSLARPAGGTPSAETRAASSGGAFAPCNALAQGAPFTVSGVYVLTVSPTEKAVGTAPVSGLGNEGAACNTDASVEGVTFGLVHLDLPSALLEDEDRLRNRVAHLMYGTEDLSSPDHPRLAEVARDPFAPRPEGYGLLGDLRPECLGECDVPLAAIFWTPGPGIRWVDMWSVRRRVVRRAGTARWGELVGDRRAAEGEAMFLQFQNQLADVQLERDPETVDAAALFRFLPAAGLLPVGTGYLRGYDYATFFDEIPFRGPAVIERAHLEELLRQSFAFPPIDTRRGEAVWLYEIRDNLLPPATVVEPEPQVCIVFTSGHMPYRADARFDLAYWNYSNFARVG